MDKARDGDKMFFALLVSGWVQDFMGEMDLHVDNIFVLGARWGGLLSA